MCLISVIIPVYNSAEYLNDCIESVISAAIPDIEIILVADGLTDESAEICRQYSAKYPCVKAYMQSGSGFSAARNHGFCHASGEYVAFFDSADYIDGKLFSDALNKLKECGADILITDFHRVSDKGSVFERVYQIQEGSLKTGRESLISFLESGTCVWNLQRYIFRREFLTSNKLRFSEAYSTAEDPEFITRALRLCQTPAFCHSPFYNYRVNYSESHTHCINVEKLRRLLRMLERAHLSLDNNDVSAMLRALLAREYIWSLPFLYELPKEERHLALRLLKNSVGLLDGADGIYSFAAKAERLLGVRIAAAIMSAAKKFNQQK